MSRIGTEELTKVLPHLFCINGMPVLCAFIEDLGVFSLVKDYPDPLAEALLTINNNVFRDLEQYASQREVPLPLGAHYQNTMLTAHILVLTNIQRLCAEGNLVLCDKPSLDELVKVNGFNHVNELALHIADLMGWDVPNKEDPIRDDQVGLSLTMDDAAKLLMSYMKGEDTEEEDEESISFFDEEG